MSMNSTKSRQAMWVGVVLVCALAASGCTGSVVTEATATVPAEATRATEVGEMETDTPRPLITGQTETPTALKFSRPRGQRHRILFTAITDTLQAIYAYDVESGAVTELFRLPPAMSLHEQPEVTVKATDGREVAIQLPKGIRSSWLFLSPDGEMLAALQPAFGGHANYLHQIELGTGLVTSIKLMQGYKWTIPIVAGREPNPFASVAPGGEAQAIVPFDKLVWAPDSSGFAFTIGDRLGPVNSIYSVKRGSAEVQALASKAPGKDVGVGAKWSSDSKSIAYARSTTADGIWLVQIKNPEVADLAIRSPAEGMLVGAVEWVNGGTELIFTAYKLENYIHYRGSLFLGNVETGEIYLLAESSASPEVSAAIGIAGLTPDEEGVILQEDSWTTAKTLATRISFLDLRGHTLKVLFEGENLLAAHPSQVDTKLLLVSTSPCQSLVYDYPSPEHSLAPKVQLCLSERPMWSADGHFLAGLSEGSLVIWDLDNNDVTTVAGDLPGEKILLGWAKEP